MIPAQRASFSQTHLVWHRARDGPPDLDNRRFDLRECLSADIDAAPRLWQDPPPDDQTTCDCNRLARHPEPGLDPATLWALATAKTNRAERFGVELSIAHTARTPTLADGPHTCIRIGRSFPTRILIEHLFQQVLVEEVGYANDVRSRLTPLRVTAARRLLSLVLARVFDDIPALALLFGAADLPRRAAAIHVDPAVAPSNKSHLDCRPRLCSLLGPERLP